MVGRLYWEDETLYPATQWDIDKLTCDKVYIDPDAKDFPILLSLHIPISLTTDTVILPYDVVCVFIQWIKQDKEKKHTLTKQETLIKSPKDPEMAVFCRKNPLFYFLWLSPVKDRVYLCSMQLPMLLLLKKSE